MTLRQPQKLDKRTKRPVNLSKMTGKMSSRCTGNGSYRTFTYYIYI